jgi:ribosomal-protein-alanine N-acetyltransferase
MSLRAPKIRPMHMTDLSAVYANECVAYDNQGWTPTILQDCLRAGYAAWVLEDPEQGLIGHAIQMMVADEAQILNVCVHPLWQGRGYGRLLLQHLIEQAREAGLASLFLEVRESNAAAQALYASAGFSQIGIRRSYYPMHDEVSSREDARVLALRL